ncbi:ribosome maturation factor RimP [Nocardia bovistercoris]|uniref:Ribosome maturation factor RimP n=1 Tax=Nocardia bovistercoris TaxID=2785916 RepID=A0A931I5H7_9NOCA|nr:ribosome maturation factor RimP [Nocardia bovistercoris]MBH0775229.1 ribosome maturation factor RimP [Nocardia bovistercoris]
MPMPTEERVSQLIAGLVERRGFDLESVEISASGRHAQAQARVTVTVDSDDSADLDTIAVLSQDLSAVLDEVADFGETPYLLEVSTPGVDRPLTADRHWRRARGRKVRVELRSGVQPPDPGGSGRFDARVGALDGEDIALVLGGKQRPHRVRVPLADIERAVVQVEFSAPGARELELAGGVAPGRPTPGREPDDDSVTIDDAATADAAETDAVSETTSDAPTEGIVE